jgi:hypothetical protein
MGRQGGSGCRVENWGPEVGGRKLEVGGRNLEVGIWRSEVEVRVGVSPEGAAYDSPGQRPGYAVRLTISPALKGRPKI